MARKVFYSFYYKEDISRTMVVRNRWLTRSTQTISGVIDKADFEKIKKAGNISIKNWIKKQLNGTSVTVVLLGSNTLSRDYVNYEICESIRRGNAIIGVHINGIKDFQGRTSSKCNAHTVIKQNINSDDIYFDEICDIYDYKLDDGYNNLANWVEIAVRKN